MSAISPQAIKHRKEQKHLYYLAHREQDRSRKRAYDVSHREALRATKKAYYLSHQEEIKAYWASRSVEKKAYNAVWRSMHPGYWAQYRESRGEEYTLIRAAQRREHPESSRLITLRRRARKRGLPDTLTLEQWRAIKAAYQHRCAYCGKKPKILTQDHVIPIAKGGGTTSDNIVPACMPCNSHKNKYLPPSIPPVRLLL